MYHELTMKGIQSRTATYFYYVFSKPTLRLLSCPSFVRASGRSKTLFSQRSFGFTTSASLQEVSYSKQSLAHSGSPEQLFEAKKAKETDLEEPEASKPLSEIVKSKDQSALPPELQTAEDFLSFVGNPKVSLRSLCMALEKLGNLLDAKQLEASQHNSSVLEDARLVAACKRLEKSAFSRHPMSLLAAREGLLRLGVKQDANVMAALNVELMWIVRRCSIKYIAQSIAYLANQLPPGEVTTVKSSTSKLASNHPLVVCVDTLQRRWVEISSGSDFISVFRVISYVNDTTRGSLEDRATDCVQDFKAIEIVKIFEALASQKRRSTPLLRALAFHYAKSTEKLQVQELISLLRSCSELTFFDSLLMTKVCTDLIPEISSVNNSALIASLLTGLGQMRHFHKELMEAVEEWLDKNLESLTQSDFAAWILSAAVLDLRSERSIKICKAGVAKLAATRNKDNYIGWINIVYALNVLGVTDPLVYNSVLTEDVINRVDSQNTRSVGAKAKLLALNAKAKLVKGYSGPSIPNETVQAWQSSCVLPSDSNLSKAVHETLKNFLPPPKYLGEATALPCGVYVDATCRVNEKLDPVALEDTNPGRLKTYPVAVLVQGFSQFTQGTKQPTGSARFNEALLQQLGYKVVTVPYTEFSPQEKLIRRVQYLEQKLRSLTVDSSSSPIPSHQVER